MTRMYGPEYLAVCGLAKYFPTMNSESSVFFVDGTSTVGNDSAANFGQTPDTPLLTITKALSLCTTKKNDYIFILNYPATAPAETWPITLTKERVHIIGTHQGPVPNFKIVAPYATEDTPVFAFTTGAAYCEIGHLIMGCGNASSTKGAIEFQTGGLWGNWIHHCGFGLTNRSGTNAAHGIYFGGHTSATGGEMLYGLIEHNTFGALITSHGIYVPATPMAGPNAVCGLVIRNNRFSVVGSGINILLAAADFKSGGIYDNKFVVANTAGLAINAASGVHGTVDGNHAVALGTSVILDAEVYQLGAAGTTLGMGWGVNYQSGTLVATEAACVVG